MNRLTKVIGAAPSELSYEALMEKLRSERSRVESGIQALRSGEAQGAKTARVASAKSIELSAEIKRLGIGSIAELAAKVKELKEKEAKRAHEEANALPGRHS
jgi:hypothetical protein